MILETITSQQFPDEYRTLAEKLENKSLFLTQQWFDNFLQTVVQKDETVSWYGLKDEKNNPIFLLPLWHKPYSALKPRRVNSLANYYTTLYEPLHCFADIHQLEAAINQIIKAVCAQQWDIIDIYPLYPKSKTYPLLIKAFQNQNMHVTPYFMYGNWYLLTQNQTYEEYYALRPSKLKNTIKRKANKLKKNTVEYKICQNPEEVATAVQLFEQTYRTSWKNDEPYPDFILGLASNAADKGWLRLGLLYIDQHVAAAQLWLTAHQTAHIYKLCQNPDFDSYSPGSLLTAYLIEYAINTDNVTKIDFLSGDDSYKKEWMSHRDERWGLQIANPRTLLGLLQTIRNLISTKLKWLLSHLEPTR